MTEINRQNLNKDEFDFIEYWDVVVKYRKLIGVIVGVTIIASIIVSLLLPKVYASTASILPPSQDNSIGSTMLSHLPEGVGSLASGLLNTKSPVDTWIGILTSKTIKDSIIARFDLMKVFDAGTIEDAEKELDRRVDISKSKEEIISITVEDKDPQRAAKMANAFVEELDRINKDVSMTSGKRMRLFVEKRLKEAKEGLAKTESDIKTFQETNQAIKLDEQSKAIIEAIGKVKGYLIGKEVELKILLSYATPNNPSVEILETEIDELRKRLKELEEGHNASTRDIFIPVSRIPNLSLQYAKLLREEKMQQTLFELLTQQYELARIQEAKDTPTIQTLDVATIPHKKVKPKRLLIVLLSTITTAFVSMLVTFFLEYLKKNREVRI